MPKSPCHVVTPCGERTGEIKLSQISQKALASLGATNKRQAVQLFVERFPELMLKVPPGRFIWQSEDARWAIFDALALAATAIHQSDTRS